MYWSVYDFVQLLYICSFFYSLLHTHTKGDDDVGGDEGSAIVSGVFMALYVSCVQEAPPGGQPSLWSCLNGSDQADTCFSLETAAAAALYSWKGSAERCDKVSLPLIFTQMS